MNKRFVRLVQRWMREQIKSYPCKDNERSLQGSFLLYAFLCGKLCYARRKNRPSPERMVTESTVFSPSYETVEG